MAEYRLVVLTDPAPGREDDYNDWYDGRHLDDVLNVPGFTAAQRFALDRPLPGGTASHGYLAIYDFETDDLDATLTQFYAVTNTPAMPISDALAPTASPVVYRVLGPPKRKDGGA